MTTNECVVSLEKIFKPGMGYVALSRVTTIGGLYLIKEDFTEKHIYSNPKIEDYLSEMVSAATLERWEDLQSPDLKMFKDQFIIVSHNTEGLLPHIEDVNHNLFLSRASIICLQETWLRNTQTVNSLPDNTLISACIDSPRDSVALFINKNIQYTEVSTAGFPI